jgi:hypothetical protein
MFLSFAIIRRFSRITIYQFSDSSRKNNLCFFGSDERPPFMNGAIMGSNKGRTIRECIRLTSRIKKKIDKIEKYADFCISHPASAQFHNRPFIQWLAIGIPVILHPSNHNSSHTPTDSHIRILHAPSDPVAKGTNIIRKTIHELRQKGCLIDYVEVVGKPHDVVLQELQRCDLIIDQVYSDTPMAMFAAEAAGFGKPALVGGYYADLIQGIIPYELIPPSLFVIQISYSKQQRR